MRQLVPQLLRLLVMLTLVLAVMIPAAAPMYAQQALPAEFLGTWEGRADTPDYFSRVTIALSGGQVGEIVGTIDYPAVESRAVACGGNVQLSSVRGTEVTLIEKLTYGTSACSYADGAIALELQTDSSLAYTWSHPNNPAVLRGTLTRTGSTTGSTTGGTTAGITDVPAGDDWCAQLVTTYAPAPTLSEPAHGALEQRQGYLTRVNAGVAVADFVASSVVYNPTTSATTPWDFGYAFRESADQTEVQQIFIDSSGMWHYAAYPDGVQASGEAPSYNFSPGDPNTLDLVVTGDTASFCLNGQFLSTVQLPPAAASDVYLMTGFLDTTLVNGRLLEYDSFATWPVAAAGAQAVPQAACQWTGDWDTPYGALRLTQNGAGVTGDYDWDQGRIAGEAQGNVFRGAWNEASSRQAPTDAGDLQFTMDADCQSFTGQWRYGTTGEWNFDWSGQRVSG